MIHFVKGFIFNILFYIFSGIGLMGAIPFLHFQKTKTGVILVAQWWSALIRYLLRYIAGVQYEFRGLQHLPKGPCIIAAKHQSTCDISIFHQILYDPALVMKKELLYVPVFGWYTKHLKMIVVDRALGRAALVNLLDQAKKALHEGRSIVIFPEGTRTVAGQRGNYQPGIAALYKLGVPIIPAATNSGVFWGRRKWQRPHGTLTLELLPPIPSGLSREEFMTTLENTIETHSLQLLPKGFIPCEN